MASLNSLPNELLGRIFAFVNCKSDLASLRLVDQSLNYVATEYYFASVPLYPHWLGLENPHDDEYDYDGYVPFPNDIVYDARMFKNILESEQLKRLVKKVDIYTCNPDCDHDPHWAGEIYDASMQADCMSSVWWECFERLPELENLRSIAVIFDRHGDSGDSRDDQNDYLLHSRESRKDLLAKVFRRLGTRIKDLAIRHCQEAQPGEGDEEDTPHDSNKETEKEEEEEEEEEEADAFNYEDSRVAILGGLRCLRMSLVHEQINPESGRNHKEDDSGKVFASLPGRWLQPAAGNLKHLTLYSDLPTGWFPKLDLRGVYFPNLETLAMGQIVYSHDWQFDWILSHQATLRGIYLDQCSILYQVGHASKFGRGWLDEEGFPTGVYDEYLWRSIRAGEETGFSEALTFRSYSTRWHEVFSRFSDSLPHLRTFRFGSSEKWNFNTKDRRDNAGCGMPIMPWESEAFIRNELFEERYLHYNDWDEYYGVQWGDIEESDIDFENQEWVAGMEKTPECDEQDQAALKALLSKMGS